MPNVNEIVKKVRNEREVRISLTNIKFRSEFVTDEERAKSEKYYILDGTPIVLDTRTCLCKDFWTGEDIFQKMHSTMPI